MDKDFNVELIDSDAADFPVRLRADLDPQGLFGLAHLPVLPAGVLFQFLAEPANLVGQRLIGGGARQEPAHRRQRSTAPLSPSPAAP